MADGHPIESGLESFGLRREISQEMADLKAWKAGVDLLCVT